MVRYIERGRFINEVMVIDEDIYDGITKQSSDMLRIHHRSKYYSPHTTPQLQILNSHHELIDNDSSTHHNNICHHLSPLTIL